ncbi:Beta-galactosidase [Halotydeus destructor]|nr:Beta-galactosidase [Halotydeus destructor]
MATELKYATVDEEGIIRSKDAEAKVTHGSLQEFLYDGLSKDADRMVFIDHPSNRQWNAGQVLQMTLKIATALDNLGLSHGHRICTMLRNDDTHALWQYGIYMADSVFVGCYWTNPYRELLHYARVAQTSAIVCCKANVSIAMQVADELDTIKCLIYVDTLESLDTKSTKGGKAIHSSLDVLRNIDKDLVLKKPLSLIGDPKRTAASIHFSSGSTGPRKAVNRTHNNYLVSLSDPESNPNDIVPQKCVTSCHNPIAHGLGGFTTLFGARDSTIVFNEGFQVTTFLEAVQNHKITAAILAPTAVNELIKSGICGNYNLDSLTWVLTAGAVLQNVVKKRAAQTLGISSLKQGYGGIEPGFVTVCPALNMKILPLASVLFFINVTVALNSFVVDYDNNQFLKDGHPFRYVSGSLHYFRVPRELWRDRLTKMRLAGLNAVQTYIEWSIHEPEPGSFIQLEDITNFIKTAQEVGLVVILRPGPYICAERDFGGFPYWLLRDNASMVIRSHDASYLKLVDRYLANILPVIRPLLYSNGGPVVMVQVENEYGSYGCDKTYTASLRDSFKKYLADDVVLFTTDGDSDNAVKCGKIDGVYATVDFGTGANVNAAFAVQRRAEPKGPLVNSEYYPGWLDHWSEPHQTVTTQRVVDTMKTILDAGASVNMYMFHGGTNFGYKNGANGDSYTYQPGPTSYDYDAPLTEAGDPTDKYFAIRTLVGNYLPLPNGTLPSPAAKLKLEGVQMLQSSTLSDIMLNFSDKVTSQYPKTFEQLKVDGGYVIYRTTINFRSSDPSQLSIPGLKDRAQIIVNGQLIGTLSRREHIFTIPLQAPEGSDLVILVENQGRLNFGSYLSPEAAKGIIGNVSLGSVVLTNWTHHYNLNFQPNSVHSQASDQALVSPPAVFSGSFRVPAGSEGLDTFLRLDGWGKGVAFVNGVNIGRYWPDQGPQVTLYIPSVFLDPKSHNYISLFETERAPCHDTGVCSISLTDTPVVNGPTPK